MRLLIPNASLHASIKAGYGLLICVLMFVACLNEAYSQTREYFSDTLLNSGKKYIVEIDSNYTFSIFSDRDTMIRVDEYLVMDWDLVDFDGDGTLDVKACFAGNVPDICDIYLFDPKTSRYRYVAGIQNYPEAKRIGRSPYFYSYHRSGCADMNWDSDLFLIENYRTVLVASMHAEGCESSSRQGITVYKFDGKGKRKIVRRLKIDAIDGYDDYKWGFIGHYWHKRYPRRLIPRKR